MTPYRESTERVRARLAFGNPKRAIRTMLAGLALIAFTVSFLGLAMVSHGHFIGSVTWPAIFGVMLLSRSRWGTMELRRDRGVLTIARRGVGLWKPQEVPIPEVQTVDVVVTSMRQKKPDYLLRLVLAGDRHITLLRGASMENLEADRQTIAAFLQDNGLMWGGRVEEPQARVRVADEGQADADAIDAPESAHGGTRSAAERR